MENECKSSEEEIANKFTEDDFAHIRGLTFDEDEIPTKKPEFIELRGQDGASVKIERHARRLIKEVENILKGDESATEIVVKFADQRSLDLLQEYVAYHLLNEPKPTPLPVLCSPSELANVLADPWDATFVQQLSAVETVKLTKVTNFLYCEGLLDILRAYLGSQLYKLSDEELKTMIKTNKWFHRADSEGEDVNLSASEEPDLCDDEDDDNIRGLDDMLLDDEKVEQQAPILLKPSDFHTMNDGSAHNNNTIIRLQELLNQQNVEEEASIFHDISADFYKSVLNYSLYHPDLMVSREELKLCILAMNAMTQDTRILNIKCVDGKTLKAIVKYLKHHGGKKPADIAKPIRSITMEKIVEDAWDADFVNSVDKKMLFQICLGANYMDISSLLHLCCAKVATMIKGKSPEEIKTILGEEKKEDETPREAGQ